MQKHNAEESIKNMLYRFFSTTEEGLSLLDKHGPRQITIAIEDVADFYKDIEEIGSSDRSCIIQATKRFLS